MEAQIDKKRVDKVKVGLVICAVLVAISAFLNICFYQDLVRAKNVANVLQVQKDTLQQQLSELNSDHEAYVSTHGHSDSEYDWLQFSYNNYMSNHKHTDSEYEDAFFLFYYVKPKQKFGVYDLEDDISGLEWNKPYQEGVFDCSEMSASLERCLENKGWHTVIVTGDSPFSSGYHAWLLVETSEGKYMPVESTTIAIVWWSNPSFDNYFVYDHEFETIQEALAWNESEFDWWA